MGFWGKFFFVSPFKMSLYKKNPKAGRTPKLSESYHPFESARLPT